MNWYTVQRRRRHSDGTLGTYVDFTYAVGMKAVRELCKGPVHYSANASYDCYRCKKGPAVYMGENNGVEYLVRCLGKWKNQVGCYVYKGQWVKCKDGI